MFKIILLLVIIVTIVNSLIISTNSNNNKNIIRSNTALYDSKVKRNANFAKLQAGYLFPEIARRRNAYLAKNPDAKIISLGIGDTTMPIPTHILSGLQKGATKLGTKDGYTGYGAEQGVKELREKIEKEYRKK